MMTRRNLLRLGLASASAPLALFAPMRAARATGTLENGGKGTIYVYTWDGGDGRTKINRGIFALDPERMTWTKVADQSDSTAYDTYFRVSPDGRFLAFERWARKGTKDAVVGVSIRDLTRDGAIRQLSAIAGNPRWSPDSRRLLIVAFKCAVPGTAMSNYESWVVNADGTEPKKLPIPETDQIDDWSPDGSWLVTGSHLFGPLRTSA
jgi:Tol biopolymer transport system component